MTHIFPRIKNQGQFNIMLNVSPVLISLEDMIILILKVALDMQKAQKLGGGILVITSLNCVSEKIGMPNLDEITCIKKKRHIGMPLYMFLLVIYSIVF